MAINQGWITGARLPHRLLLLHRLQQLVGTVTGHHGQRDAQPAIDGGSGALVAPLVAPLPITWRYGRLRKADIQRNGKQLE